MCLFRRFHLQGLRSPKMRSLLVVNEQFSDKRNEANGTLWTDTNHIAISSFILINRSLAIKYALNSSSGFNM